MRITEIQKPKFSNWVFPKSGTLQADFDEYKKKETSKWEARATSMGFRFPIFPTLNDFVSALKSAKVVTLTPQQDSNIMNRSHTGSIDSLKSLVSRYSKPRDVDRIIQGFQTNASIPYPIVLKGAYGEWIMAGNTRLDTAFIMGIAPKVLLVDVSKGNITESDDYLAADLKEMLDQVEEEIQKVSDASMDYDSDSEEWAAAEKDTRALVAIEAVIKNNLKAISKNLLDNNIFLYDYDGDVYGGVAAIHVQINGEMAEVKWIGSYSAPGGELFKKALAQAKAMGARKVKVDAKWNSEGFYRKMGLVQGDSTEFNPISNSQLTSFSGTL